MSFPFVVTASVAKYIVPPFEPTVVVDEPKIEQFVNVLLIAPPINLNVDVPETADVLKLEIVNEFPPVFKPLKVTLSAPEKSINCKGATPVVVPLIVLAPCGFNKIEVQFAEALNELVPNSAVLSPVCKMVTEPVPATAVFNAAKAPAAFVKLAYPIPAAKVPAGLVTIKLPTAGVQE